MNMNEQLQIYWQDKLFEFYCFIYLSNVFQQEISKQING